MNEIPITLVCGYKRVHVNPSIFNNWPKLLKTHKQMIEYGSNQNAYREIPISAILENRFDDILQIARTNTKDLQIDEEDVELIWMLNYLGYDLPEYLNVNSIQGVNVGGRMFFFNMDELKSFNKLYKMVHAWKPTICETEGFPLTIPFIDRDPGRFYLILSHIRDGIVDEMDEQLKEEYDYYS